MKTVLERAAELTYAEEWLRIAAEKWTNRGDTQPWQRVDLAKDLADKAVRYTQSLQAFARAARK